MNPQESTLSPKGVKLGSIVPHPLKGFFKSREELDDYEKTWHLYIYQPTWNELKSKVKKQREIHVLHVKLELFMCAVKSEIIYMQCKATV